MIPLFITSFLPSTPIPLASTPSKPFLSQRCKFTPSNPISITRAVLKTNQNEQIDNNDFNGLNNLNHTNTNLNSTPISIHSDFTSDDGTVPIDEILDDEKREQSPQSQSLSSTLPEQDDTDIDTDTNDANEMNENNEPPTDTSWFTIVEQIGIDDVQPSTSMPVSNNPEEGVLDLGALDGESRQQLTVGCYEKVVNIDIEKGGVLPDDDDNNDLLCGVGVDALIENEKIIENLEREFKIKTLTHVQLSGIPRVLDGRDLVMQSHTGTGKTFAFLLPMLDGIIVERNRVQGVIVVPTRELGMQISRECDRLIQGTGIRNLALIGGTNPARQVDKLRRLMPHIVVGTPGRLAELVSERDLKLGSVKTLVVDEVDHCLEEAFVEDIVYLLQGCNKTTQKILVSATSDVDSVRQFSRRYLHKPVLLRVGGMQRIPKGIEHWFCVVPARLKIETVRKLMFTEPVPSRAIVFVDDPRRVDIVVEKLYEMKIRAGALRGNAHKLERAEVLNLFRKGKMQVLVTTEVAARGLDVPEISHVINVDLPTDGDHYLHRAGRCGRAGNSGTVISIVTGETAFVMGRLSKEVGVKIVRMEPRGGEYREPLDRSERNEKRSKTVGGGPRDVKSRERREMSKRPSNGEKKMEGSEKRSASKSRVEKRERGSSQLTIEELRRAIEKNDMELIESSINWAEDDKVDDNSEDSGKTKKKSEMKTKKTSETKSKKKKSKLKSKGTTKESLGSKRKESKNNFKNPNSTRAIAKREGWVGNRRNTE